MKAENYIALGYQRLLTFEAQGGGFSLFSGQTPSVMLSAKGLMEFGDMAKVYPVDPALIDRTRQWLLHQQKPDGTWDGIAGWDHPPSGNAQDPLPLTSIVAWALADSGNKDDAGLSRAIAYVKENASRANDAYTLALIANALVAYNPNDSMTQSVLARLDGMKVTDKDTIYWETKTGSFSGAYGQAGNIETTALAAYAFFRAHQSANTANGALAYLMQKKDPRGTWGSTQATILALRALVQSVIDGGDPATDATVHVSLNGREAKAITINKENTGVVQLVTFDDITPGANQISFKVDGKGSLAYQVSANYYLPWSAVPPTPEKDKLVDIQVKYDRTTLAVNDQVGVTAKIALTKQGSARMTLVDLGVPPGFTVMSEDLDAAVKAKTISRYELTGRQIIVYLEEFAYGKTITLNYHLQARFPLKAQTPSSTTYDYYNPSTTSTQAPTLLVVR